jgi:dihydrolipoamide dehydrogenase
MYDLVVIGAGWAGINAAIRARQMGQRVCLVERSKIGGTCLNHGCIPTKALIQSAKVFSLCKKSDTFGIITQGPKINFSLMQSRKDRIVADLFKGLEFVLKGVDILNAEARLVSAQEVKVGSRQLTAKNIMIATGSRPTEIPNLKFDFKKIITSNEMLELKEIPSSLLIVGGGVIGCEFASLFSSLGTQVSIAEKMPGLLPGEDMDIAKKIENIFKKRKIKIHLNCDVSTLNLNDYELILICAGRLPDTGSLNLEGVGVKLEGRKICVDDYLRTNLENIYAAGDCAAKSMLAHFAAYQGSIAAENCANPGQLKKADNQCIPNCIFTDPEIASVGLSEDKAIQQGIAFKVSKFDFLGLAMARILDETEGFIKVISEEKTGRLLGACLIGPRVTELVSVFNVAITCRQKVPDLKETIFAHPTLSESIHEALPQG